MGQTTLTGAGCSFVGTPAIVLPSLIPNLLVWLKSDGLPYIADDPIGSWFDSSGNANVFGMNIAPWRPTYKANIVNGQPAVFFPSDGSGNFYKLQRTGINYVPANPTSGECFFVIKVNADPPSAPQFNIFGQMGTDPAEDTWPFTDNKVLMGWGSTVRKDTGNAAPALTSWRLLNIRSATNSYVVEIDGAAHFSTATNTPGFTTSPLIGGGVNGPLGGHIAEMIFYSRVLSSGERTQVKAYIADRFALTIA